jgi:hypothetical protein
MRILAVALVCLVMSGCALQRPIQFGGQSGGWGWKTVEGKEAPSTLYAVDSTVCVVTARKYEQVKVGDRVTCRWLRRGDSPVAPRTE